MTGNKIAFVVFCAVIAAYCVFAVWFNIKKARKSIGQIIAEELNDLLKL